MNNDMIEKLLGRDPVEIDNCTALPKAVYGKRILVTGASGSIGSELVRQLAAFKPAVIVLFDRNENNMFFLEKQLRKEFKDIMIVPRLGSICDKKRVNAIFEEIKPQLVYHAAANKHVPLSEQNPVETVFNNVVGTDTIACAAHDFETEVFVLISTDKAVNPTSVMGATKRVSELLVYTMNSESKTKFIAVRFGNVLGSAGSVVPIFEQQIKNGGPVTVTHPDMTRFFMSIPEASRLLIQASAVSNGGEIFVLDMGEPVKIVDLAENMIKLMEYSLDDISIHYSGVRPGEKINEELFLDIEETVSTAHPKIRKTTVEKRSLEEFEIKYNDLINITKFTTPKQIREKLSRILPEAILSEQ